MAQQYRCDICNEVAADFMVTSIIDGHVVAVGVECVLDWAMPIAHAFQEAVEHQQQGSTEGQEAAGEAPEEWEDGYPQGRSEGDTEPSGDSEDDEREDSEAGQAAHVNG